MKEIKNNMFEGLENGEWDEMIVGGGVMKGLTRLISTIEEMNERDEWLDIYDAENPLLLEAQQHININFKDRDIRCSGGGLWDMGNQADGAVYRTKISDTLLVQWLKELQTHLALNTGK